MVLILGVWYLIKSFSNWLWIRLLYYFGAVLNKG